MSVLDYNKFDNLDVSSDEDDCHPNIEINTWRRLKARMREEKGIVKREPILFDKWNSTKVNTKKQKYDITGQGNDDVQREDDDDDQDDDGTANADNSNNNDDTIVSSKNDTNESTEKKSDSNNDDNESKEASAIDKNENGKAKAKPKAQAGPQPQAQAQSQLQSQEPQKESRAKPETNKNLFEARSDPKVYLDEYLPKIKKFAKMKNNDKADLFLRKNYDLVHQATEGYIITFAVDRAVEGATQKQLQKYSRRCLTIHNLIQSCQSANVSPKVGVNLFFSKMENKQMKQMYAAELEKQVMELMGRIEIRRKERIKEAEEALAQQEDGVEYVEEKAPLGPGGLDPTEVLNALPPKMQQAFVNRDVGQLKQVLSDLPLEEAQKYMKMCVDSGLWVDNAEDDEQAPPDDDNGAPDTTGDEAPNDDGNEADNES